MKAAIKPRINLENRTALEKIIPLQSPMIVFVDPSSACNFRCKFCPTGESKTLREARRWQGQMDFQLYKKIIDDISEFEQPLKVLRLYKDGEPLLNKRFADMVRYAKKAGITEYIDTTTNGSLLDTEKIKPILDAGIDRINISINGLTSEQLLEFTKTQVDFDRYIDNIRMLYEMSGDCEICIKIVGDFLSDNDKTKFYDIFGDYADRIFIENIAPCWPEFDVKDRLPVNMDKGIYNQPLSQVQTCPYIFYSISINSEGTVSLCFLDWARKLLVGDVRKSSLKEIWEGALIFDFRVKHLKGQRGGSKACAECGQLSHGMPDNIDLYADRLLEKIRAAHLGHRVIK